MGFFDDSHVTDVGLQGSAGPSVGFGEMIQQGFRQQFRTDSALALNNELQNRWSESLRLAQINNSGISGADESWAYVAMAQHIQGQPIDVNESPSLDVLTPVIGPLSAARTLGSYVMEPDRLDKIKGMIEANEAIKKLNDPRIKSFEQILEEVSEMQHEVEGDTASMYDRSGSGGFVASLLGTMAGSFTVRDPLNIITAPIGVGRTVATRIASEMGIAAATVGATEILQVAPARKVVGLPERNPLYNIAAAALGAGVIRGGLEGIGASIRGLRGSEVIDFDLRDSQLVQMFEANSDKPSARAGASILNDVTFIERNNPYGEGQASQARFLAELQSVQRAMNAEPMTAIARVLPPVPFEQIKKVADFELVREQTPQVYARMEAAQTRLASLQEVKEATHILNWDEFREAGDAIEQFRARVDEAVERGDKVTLYKDGEPIEITGLDLEDASGNYHSLEKIIYDHDGSNRIEITSISSKVNAKERQAANIDYQAAYRAVEAEAATINARQQAAQATQQHESINILASEGLPFTGPLLRYDNVESLADRINKFNDTLDERTAARFVRETLGEGENKVEVEVWERDGGIDIGLKDPVDPNFKFVTDEGEMTVAQAMRDLQADTDLVEAIKVCSI